MDGRQSISCCVHLLMPHVRLPMLVQHVMGMLLMVVVLLIHHVRVLLHVLKLLVRQLLLLQVLHQACTCVNHQSAKHADCN